MVHHGTYAQLGCQWLTMGTYTHRNMPVALSGLTHTHTHGHSSLSTGLTLNSDAGGPPWDLHTTRMPMAHHGTYIQHGCRWLTVGLTHNSDANGSPRDLRTTRMPMAHHGDLYAPQYAGGSLRTYTHTHTRAQLALHGTYTQLGCRWLTTGLTRNTDANGSPRDSYTTRMPMAHRRTYTQHGCQWLTTGLTHNTDANGSP